MSAVCAGCEADKGRLRIPIRGYETEIKPVIDASNPVTNPYKGL